MTYINTKAFSNEEPTQLSKEGKCALYAIIGMTIQLALLEGKHPTKVEWSEEDLQTYIQVNELGDLSLEQMRAYASYYKKLYTRITGDTLK